VALSTFLPDGILRAFGTNGIFGDFGSFDSVLSFFGFRHFASLHMFILAGEIHKIDTAAFPNTE
jgi:hypothetical protein